MPRQEAVGRVPDVEAADAGGIDAYLIGQSGKAFGIDAVDLQQLRLVEESAQPLPVIQDLPGIPGADAAQGDERRAVGGVEFQFRDFDEGFQPGEEGIRDDIHLLEIGFGPEPAAFAPIVFNGFGLARAQAQPLEVFQRYGVGIEDEGLIGPRRGNRRSFVAPIPRPLRRSLAAPRSAARDLAAPGLYLARRKMLARQRPIRRFGHLDVLGPDRNVIPDPDRGSFHDLDHKNRKLESQNQKDQRHQTRRRRF